MEISREVAEMSCRRSSRLLSKTAQKAVNSDLILEDEAVFSLRSGSGRTPRSSCGRNGQKRKRGTPVSTPSSIDAPEVGRTSSDAILDVSPAAFDLENSPKVLTQSRFKNPGLVGRKRLAGGTSPAFCEDVGGIKNDLSFGNDSFLMAVKEMENDEDKIETANNVGNCSTDMFGDDEDMLEILLESSKHNLAGTPKSGRKRSANDRVKENEDGFIPASELLQKSVELNTEDKSITRAKRSTGGRGRRKTTRAGAQGQAQGPGYKRKRKGNFKLAFTNRKAIKELANSASNELSKEDLSFLSNDEKLQLSSWGLPPSILANYRSKGITSLFPWQLECLANEKVLEGRNLLYSAPTSAGKTLVSEILMIKRVLELGRKAIMILPFVSVAREKVYSLQSIFGDAGVRVEGFMGSINPPGGFKAVDIAICTIEKANSLINKLLEENLLSDLGTLVVDELHLIGDPHRGYLLELLLTKILYMTSIKNKNSENSMNVTEDASWKPRRFNIQVIGMSATFPNLDLLATWLNAELYVTNFRPVPLQERLKVDDKLLDEALEPVRDVKIESIPVEVEGDADNIIYLTLETVLNGFSVLIFCPTKALVERTAEKIAQQFFHIGDPTKSRYPEIGEKLRSQLNGMRIKTVMEQLQRCPGGADEVLSKTVMFGIGYHHAGLTYENRDIVESAFKRGVLRVIVATSTLSAGVNLPARRVIIVTPMFNGNLLDIMTYRQMCGRAGRNGIDSEGESILICPTILKEQGKSLFRGVMPVIRSALLGDGSLTSSMKRALLEAIASGIASLPSDVRSYAKCTFLFHTLESGLYNTEELTSSQMHKDSTVDQCLEYLETQDFIRIKRYEHESKPDEYMPTQLGSACLASSLSPDDGIIVFKELVKARECFVLENELHVIYQVTPIYVSDQLRNISWMDYLRIWEHLDESEKKVSNLVGIQEGFIIRAMIGTVSWKNPNQRADMAIHQRFFAALALSDLVNEKTLDFVSKKYSLNKGVVQNLQQAASTFAGMVTAFCNRLGWSNLELLLSQFQERLEFGVQRELCDLVRLDCLNGQRARILYDAGLKTVMELAAADAAQVEHVLHKATPFKSTVHGGKESNIWMLGKESLTEGEAAQKIVLEARLYIQVEMGQQGNIQFAFGKNDIPPSPVSVKHKVQPEESENSDSLSENESVENQSEEAEDSKNKDGETRTVRNEDDVECVASQKYVDVDMEEIFSQRQLEEQNNSQFVADIDLENSQDLFEDSFPEVVVTNLSKLYPPENRSIPQVQQKIHQKSNASTTNENSRDQFSNEVQNGAEERPLPVICKTNQLHCSTPHTDTKSKQHAKKYQQPLTPVSFYSPSKPKSKGEEGYSTDESEKNLLIAEENEPLEVETENPALRDTKEAQQGLPKGKAKTTVSIQLSESDAAALKAMAEDSNFESEELFNPSEPKEMDNKPGLPCAKSEKELFDLEGFDEEDFILTQGPVITDENIDDEDLELFEESSSDTEPSTSWKDGCSITQSSSTVSSSEYVCGRSKITVKITQCAEKIPTDFFPKHEMIGIGLKLVPQKKSSSIALNGIGARVIGKKAKVLNATISEDDQMHSLAVYNGRDTIWIFRWKSENVIGVKKCNNNDCSSARTNTFEALLSKLITSSCALAMFDSKDKLRSLVKTCGSDTLRKLTTGNRIWDPRIAQWMWEFDDEDWNISKHKLIDEYVSAEDKNISSLGLAKEICEAFYVWKVMAVLKQKLEKANLWHPYTETEMPSILPLLLMEMNGFGIDPGQLSKLKRLLQFKCALLELRAYQLAGRQFNIASPKDVKQVLFRDIGLKQPKSKGTGKDVLLKLDHELPGVIVEWRKVHNALQKIVIPFQQERSLDTGRIHGQYSHFTVTGRVVMSDPSLQCIPRDFDIPITYDPKDVDEIKQSCRIKFGSSKLAALFQQIDNELMDPHIIDDTVISMRNVFIPCSSEFILLTADYSQLELRILAHLSQDPKLIGALNANTDVFVEIASQWKNVPKDKITNTIRQEAKGIIYGVIYGMGIKSLSEQMEIDEREAGAFQSQFMRAYPGVKSFLDKAVKKCQENGYVETMMGRRRYLPHINSRNPQEQRKASRQAVNTQIQGSASDLVKTAMTRIHSFLSSKYPKSSVPIEWSKIAKASRRSSLSVGSNKMSLDNLIFFPILNLHDELIFEVRKAYIMEVAKEIKHAMESSMQLQVQLPVVIKTGESWGSLEPYQVT